MESISGATAVACGPLTGAINHRKAAGTWTIARVQLTWLSLGPSWAAAAARWLATLVGLGRAKLAAVRQQLCRQHNTFGRPNSMAK